MTFKNNKLNIKRKGVIFIKNIPNNLYLRDIKNIFLKFGSIGKFFFYLAKKKNKKIKKEEKKIFGWIEYVDKTKAKIVSNFFRKKINLFYFNFLNLKCYYLKNFKWNDLGNFYKKKF
jgi:hypothetical protein